jgi:hypothetical protein
MGKSTAPVFQLAAFHCPHCGTYAKQSWFNFVHATFSDAGGQTVYLHGMSVARCDACNGFSLWQSGKMIYPISSITELPNDDLPPELLDDYNEARNIFQFSPRGSAALLRLLIQKLCKALGEKGSNINDDIAELVKKGLPVSIQRALDSVRVIGNEAVHPGELDLRDDPELAASLFSLVNLIVENRITNEKRIAEIYAKLPAEKVAAIEKRDGGEQ